MVLFVKILREVALLAEEGKVALHLSVLLDVICDPFPCLGRSAESRRLPDSRGSNEVDQNPSPLTGADFSAGFSAGFSALTTGFWLTSLSSVVDSAKPNTILAMFL